jgi:hypothetical protein
LLWEQVRRTLWRRYASSSIHQRGLNQSKAPEAGLGG